MAVRGGGEKLQTEALVADSGHEFRCMLACELITLDALQIVYFSGNLALALRGCSWTHCKNPIRVLTGKRWPKVDIDEKGSLKDCFSVVRACCSCKH